MKPIRLFSIEDHWVVIRGLKMFRADKDGLVVTCHALNMKIALNMDPDKFDVILLDLIIPGTDPEDNLRSLLNVFPDKPVIIFTADENSAWELKMYKLGAVGFLIKSCTRRQFIDTVRNAVQEKGVRSERISELEKNTVSDVQHIWNNLSSKEREIIELLSRETNIKSIPDKVGMSVENVYKRLFRLRKRLNIVSNIGLYRYFRRVL